MKKTHRWRNYSFICHIYTFTRFRKTTVLGYWPTKGNRAWIHTSSSGRSCRNGKKWKARHTHTHTRLTALFPGLPGWAGTSKVKPIRILLKQRDSEWQWYQLGHDYNLWSSCPVLIAGRDATKLWHCILRCESSRQQSAGIWNSLNTLLTD